MHCLHLLRKSIQKLIPHLQSSEPFALFSNIDTKCPKRIELSHFSVFIIFSRCTAPFYGKIFQLILKEEEDNFTPGFSDK